MSQVLQEESRQLRVSFEKHPELLKQLDEMADMEDSDRSKFVRKLIRQAYQAMEIGQVNPNQETRRKAFKKQVEQVTR